MLRPGQVGSILGVIIPDINELLRDHVPLEVECMDRIYLNGYVPKLQTGGQLVTFIMERLGKPIPSPALLGELTQDFLLLR